MLCFAFLGFVSVWFGFWFGPRARELPLLAPPLPPLPLPVPPLLLPLLAPLAAAAATVGLWWTLVSGVDMMVELEHDVFLSFHAFHDGNGQKQARKPGKL